MNEQITEDQLRDAFGHLADQAPPAAPVLSALEARKAPRARRFAIAVAGLASVAALGAALLVVLPTTSPDGPAANPPSQSTQTTQPSPSSTPSPPPVATLPMPFTLMTPPAGMREVRRSYGPGWATFLWQTDDHRWVRFAYHPKGVSRSPYADEELPTNYHSAMGRPLDERTEGEVSTDLPNPAKVLPPIQDAVAPTPEGRQGLPIAHPDATIGNVVLERPAPDLIIGEVVLKIGGDDYRVEFERRPTPLGGEGMNPELWQPTPVRGRTGYFMNGEALVFDEDGWSYTVRGPRFGDELVTVANGLQLAGGTDLGWRDGK
ncbi:MULTISPECIES: hypothetical protein [Actinosynnema]|uniref:hypothetical protein n=1 Tax=Actinosynnema TaxID=40566 RepID=UPI0020A5988B|nr:hypothetical protein [Actinosynnema pretiosum]MCP2097936.1 hypothetical protein [Actinosynnema pretiosum]